MVLVGRDRARLDAAVGRIGEGGPEVLAASADGRDEQALARILDPVGSVDHALVTAGGLEGAGTIDKLTPEAVRSTLEARIWGALAAARVTAPRLPAGGSITLTSGVYSIRPVPGMTAPLAAIGAVEALTGALAVEFAPRRIRVNTVRYGNVDTPLRRSAAGLSTDEAVAEAGAATLLGRFATPAEAAAPAYSESNRAGSFCVFPTGKRVSPAFAHPHRGIGRQGRFKSATFRAVRAVT